MSAIVPSVRALSSCSGYGTLIVPQWPSASFWPFLHESSSRFKSFVKGVFELPCMEDLLFGRSWLEANLQGASIGFQWFPEIQNVSLAGRFSVSFCHPCLPCTSLFFQLYSSPCHCWSFSLASLCFAWFGSVILVSSLTSVCFAQNDLLPDLASSFWPYVLWAKLILRRVCYFIGFCLIWQYLLGRFDGFCGISFSVCIMYLLFYVILPFVFLLTLILFYFL